MSSQYLTLSNLPELVDGRRYSHELRNPKPIPEHIRPDVLQLLRKYYTEVCIDVPTLSEASRTNVREGSEVSAGTSITDMTFAFSASNGSLQRESTRRQLTGAQRARKALLRKLQACLEDCRKRKVKCKLWHHSLRDLLEIDHEPSDEMIVEWAIKFDTEYQTPVPVTTISARVSTFVAGGAMEERNEVLHQATNAFNLPHGTPTPYEPIIQETTASLLNPEDVIPGFLAPLDTLTAAGQPPYIYSILWETPMLLLGVRDYSFSPAHYRCEFPDCDKVLPMQYLISHFEIDHHPFEHLNDPLRMACLGCGRFYAYSNDECQSCPGLPLVENLYGRHIPGEPTMVILPENGVLYSGVSTFATPGIQNSNVPSYQGSSLLPNYGLDHYGTSPYGFSGNPAGSYYSTAGSAISNLKDGLLSLQVLPLYLFSPLVRRCGYIAAFVIAATVSLVLGYKNHNWIVSNLVRLTHGIPDISPSELPSIGVMFASIAFGLHRIIVHAYRANSIRRGSRLYRCVLSVLNVACGRWRPEWQGYELGHSRS